jgi:hypothetical protein
MPVLGEDHVVMSGDEPVDLRHHRSAVRDGERAPGAKVVLHIDDGEDVHDLLLR